MQKYWQGSLWKFYKLLNVHIIILIAGTKSFVQLKTNVLQALVNLAVNLLRDNEPFVKRGCKQYLLAVRQVIVYLTCSN